ncbi:MAG: hypothetical protein EOP67_36880, partial [Sphingomonas sp.]
MHIPTITAPSVAIAGTTDRFPVRRIFCVGQNYADHAREMGSDPDRQEPFFFSKPADAVVANGSTLPFPPQTQDLHHEVELVIALGAGGKDIAVADADRGAEDRRCGIGHCDILAACAQRDHQLD